MQDNKEILKPEAMAYILENTFTPDGKPVQTAERFYGDHHFDRREWAWHYPEDKIEMKKNELEKDGSKWEIIPIPKKTKT